ncbi:GNAT family N-acetyltransferase [Flaviaesturariibacter amylovorans]|uniref:GNAT family N-acetyltransferase n=1 Tax=Flaviaesturariibacter amylovorans TaxID=1084520 RepID=A0ABP8HSS6_9BACT
MIEWRLKPFAELTPFELYEILWLRNEVFVVEQNCVFQDADHKDADCQHLMGWQMNEGTAPGGQLAAYTRLVPPGAIYTEASIGRVVTNPAARGTGAGRLLMAESIRSCTALFGEGPIRIGAQLYLKAFYESFGFAQVSEPYLEDGIPHIYMLRP